MDGSTALIHWGRFVCPRLRAINSNVDDLVLGRLQETVTAAGYNVRTAGSGVESLYSL
jgi:hypothetical protein